MTKLSRPVREPLTRKVRLANGNVTVIPLHWSKEHQEYVIRRLELEQAGIAEGVHAAYLGQD